MQIFRIQCLSRGALDRNQGADVEDMPWEDTDHVSFSERRADSMAAELTAHEDGRFVFRVVAFDLVRAA